MHITLIVHITLAILSIVVAVLGLVAGQKIASYSHRLFLPSAVGVFVSGVLLVMLGGSFTHACISGSVTLGLLFALRFITIRKLAAEQQ